MSLDLSIGRGDNAPALTWKLPFDVEGSDFVLVLTLSGGTRSFSVTGGTLTLDPVGNTVSWPVTAEQSAALPNVCTYTLRRILPGGERRFYAEGRITARDGPVGAQSVAVQVPGPQGRPGEVGPDGRSAYEVAVANGFAGTETEWLASLASGGITVLTLPITAASSFTASHNFPYRPRAWLVDATGAEVETDILHAPGQVTAVFPGPFTGTLYLG